MTTFKPQRHLPSFANQRGITLIVVIVVLLGLTLVGLASTDSGNLQRVMVRNNQLRLEAFNSSAAEIAAQIQFYEEVTNAPIYSAIDSGLRLSDGDQTLTQQTVHALIDKDVGLSSEGDCWVVGNTLGKYRCNLLMIDSNSQYPNTNIGSDQRQTFSYFTLE